MTASQREIGVSVAQLPILLRRPSPGVPRVILFGKSQSFPDGVAEQLPFADIGEVSPSHAELHDALALAGQLRPARASLWVLLDAVDGVRGEAEFHRAQLLGARHAHRVGLAFECNLGFAFHQGLSPYRNERFRECHGADSTPSSWDGQLPQRRKINAIIFRWG